MLGHVIKISGIPNLKEWNSLPGNEFIGRYDRRSGLTSKWGKPYSINKFDRRTCIAMYREHLLNNKDLMNSLHELKGQTLGCYCAPLYCHGDVLLELINK